MKKIFLTTVTAAILAGGCGSGNDPLDAVGDAGTTPSFGAPVSGVTAGTIAPFTTTAPYFEFASFGFAVATSVTTPAAGVVVSVTQNSDTTNAAPNGTVTIFHNSRFTTRLSKLLLTTLRAGDVVAAGGAVGTTTNFLRWEVLVDGASVCPYLFLTSDARTFVNSRLVASGNLQPCQ